MTKNGYEIVYDSTQWWRDVTEAQIDYLRDLGYSGSEDIDMKTASELIGRFKKGKGDFTETQWQKRREKWRKDWLGKKWLKAVIGDQIRDCADDFIVYEVELSSFAFQRKAKQEQLLGWSIDFLGQCNNPCRKTIENLIFPACLTIADLVDHLPPYSSCPDCCQYCDIKQVRIKDHSLGQNYAIWDNMQFRKSIPKYISKLPKEVASYSGGVISSFLRLFFK